MKGHSLALTVAGSTSLDSAADFVTDKIFVQFIDSASMVFTVPAGPTGTLVIQTSDDDGQQGPGNPNGATASASMNWVDVSGTSSTINGVTGSPWRYDFTKLTARYIRAKFTSTGGTGIIAGRLTVKAPQ